MRATDSLDLEIGESEIPMSIYSAIEGETSFNNISKCCDARVNYKKICSNCSKELSEADMYKALEIGKGEYKKVDATKVKVEKTNLRVQGTIDDDSEENGYVKNGKVWFLGIQLDKKNNSRNERNITKFCYIRDALRESGKSLVCLVAVRGVEHAVLIKPYFEGLIGIGIYFFDRIRDIKEVPGYNLEMTTDSNKVLAMAETLKKKENIPIKDIVNRRSEILEQMANEMDSEVIVQELKKEETLNPEELVNF